jgi:hypothetical protein
MTANEKLSVLCGDEVKKNEGTFVLNGQELASKEGFGHVSKIWYKKTLSYAEGLEAIEKGKSETEDINAPIGEMVATVNAGKFAFLHRKSERYFQPTGHAIRQCGNWAGTGTWYVEQMLQPIVLGTGKSSRAVERDEQDASTLAQVVNNGLRRLDPAKPFLWRTRKDGTLRAMLTDRYAIVDNRWFVELLQRLIPGGRLSHWRGDCDTVYGNVLIPDTIREEKDSDYGGMLSIGNSEIGERRVSSLPSIFRAICMNGCIWGRTVGKSIRQVHRGAIDLDKLAYEVKQNLNEQIPLLPQGIDRLLGTRSYAWDGTALPIVAALVSDYKLSKKQATAVLTGYSEESRLVPEYAKTLFGLANAVTRAGQRQENAEWVKFDEIGGEISEYSKNDFDRLVSRGRSLKAKEVEEVFAAN